MRLGCFLRVGCHCGSWGRLQSYVHGRQGDGCASLCALTRTSKPDQRQKKQRKAGQPPPPGEVLLKPCTGFNRSPAKQNARAGFTLCFAITFRNQLQIAQHFLDDFLGDAPSLQNAAQGKSIETNVVDGARDALAVLCDQGISLRSEQRRLEVVPRHPQAMLDLKASLLGIERAEAGEDGHSLAELKQLRRGQLLAQLRLA